MNNHACSGVPQTVIITDVNYDTSLGPNRFDLSGTAFGAMDKPGLNGKLRDAGALSIQYRRSATVLIWRLVIYCCQREDSSHIYAST